MATEAGIFLFKFAGRAVTRASVNEEESESIIVRQLNEVSYEIAEEIQEEVRRVLPPSVLVQSEIQFFEGSISWIGVVTVLDWMARIAGAVELIEMFSNAIQFVVERVMRRWLSGRRIPIRLRLAGPIQVEVSYQMPESAKRQSDQIRALLVLSALNTLLLVAFLISQILQR